jgi:hypothetical protein
LHRHPPRNRPPGLIPALRSGYAMNRRAPRGTRTL